MVSVVGAQLASNVPFFFLATEEYKLLYGTVAHLCRTVVYNLDWGVSKAHAHIQVNNNRRLVGAVVCTYISSELLHVKFFPRVAIVDRQYINSIHQ